MNTKKTLLLLLVVFLGFWMVNDPAGLADAAGSGAGEAWTLLSSFFEAVIGFVGEL